MISEAKFNDDGRLRFWLSRIWNSELPLVLFIGLNPSIADAKQDDPTLRRVMRFARDWGYGGVYMTNCFPHISTDPNGLDPVVGLQENDELLKSLSQQCERVVFAWGAHGSVRKSGRDKHLSSMFPEAMALQVNKDGSPKHPLYVRADIKPVRFVVNAADQNRSTKKPM